MENSNTIEKYYLLLRNIACLLEKEILSWKMQEKEKEWMHVGSKILVFLG